MIYLDVVDLLHIAERTLGARPVVRDLGLLDSAAARPSATVFGADAYPSIEEKGAALLQSIVANHALTDGNKRLGLAALLAFLGINDRRLTMTNDEAYDFVLAVIARDLPDVESIAAVLRARVEPWT